MIEMGKSDHQRAFLSLGQAVRVAAMLGLHRMDEDRIAERTGVRTERRLRPPALHPLPSEPILLEECRRTMCAIHIINSYTLLKADTFNVAGARSSFSTASRQAGSAGQSR